MAELVNIDTSFESYQKLISFYHDSLAQSANDSINLSLHNWFAANMSAVLGSLIDLLNSQSRYVNLHDIDSGIEAILSKNRFLSYFGFPKRDDIFHSTIPYQKLKPSDGKYFNKYVVEELIGRTELPKMSDLVKQNMAIAIYEIFVNAQIHSNSDNIYTCGQYYYQKDKIEFTIVDTGIGFKKKVNNRFGVNLTSVQAIKWAIKDKNTTKEEVTGGIGLALLKEFVEKNNGKMQIISDDGFYQYSRDGEQTSHFTGFFPGTVVNLQFRTDDNSSYIMVNELNSNDIF